MNNKTKIMLGLSALTAGTLAAGATGTLAWFSTNKTAKATYSKITAKASTAKIKLTIGKLSDDSIEKDVSNLNEKNEWLDSVSLQGGTKSFTTDLSSGDGKTFKKPTWASQAGNEQDVTSLANVTEAGESYTQFYVELENTGTSPVEVFLNQDTKITPSNSEKNADVALSCWSRAAVIDYGTEAKPTKDSVLTAKETQYVFENQGTAAYTANVSNFVTGLGENKKLTMGTFAEGIHKVGEFATVSETSKKEKADGYLTQLAASAKHYYVISVWMEGTENDNQDIANDGSIDVTLGFTGLDKIA